LSNGGRRDKHGNMRSAIPYRIYGGLSFYQRKEVKDAICYFRLIINPDDDEALRRVINYPSRGIGDTTVGKINHCATENGVSMWQVINQPEQYGLNANRGTLSKLEAFATLIRA
jgi:DNA helicase-2/ATP-dependent DNA helicase PcrA